MEENALLYGIGLFVIDMPWYAMGTAPFLEQARVKKRTMVLFAIVVGLIKAVSGGLLLAFVPGWRTYVTPHFFINSLILFFFYWRCFNTTVAKLLYSMLLIHAFSTAVNYLAYVAVALIQPAQIISLSVTPAYTVAILVGSLLAVPFVWRFFRGRLRQAFLELPAKSIRLLCAPPILFYVFIQIYTATIQTTGLSVLTISFLNLLLVAVGLVTYYINLRTVLDGAASARAESELQAQLALKEQAAQVRSDMIDTLSHEVRTPLSVMSVYAQLAVRQIQDGKVTPQTATDLLTISEEAKRLAELADSTMQLSRLSTVGDAAQLEPAVAVVDIAAVTGQICRLFATMAKQRGRALAVRLPEGLPAVRCDADSLTRLLWNLLDNALTHSGHGDITVSGEADGDTVRITVKDEGVGVPAELLPRVFERGVSGAEDGTGLGLALSRQTARQHGGDVALESEAGRGTTAILTLPAAAPGEVDDDGA